jgi:RNA polymerase sigma-70 factor, ECF subfamily
LGVPESFSWDRKLYAQLHALAVDRLGPGRSSTTLCATALLHEAYLRLVKADALQVPRRELVAMASYAIRSALIDQARKKRAEKRGGLLSRRPLDDSVCVYEQRAGNLLSLDEALTRLHDVDRRLADIVNLRFFGGLSEDEIASALEVSTRTVRRDWQLARAWLRKELTSWSDE